MTGHNALVELKNASRHYHQGDEIVRALNSVSLQIQSGEFTTLCGPSGSGKTTLLNIIGALDSLTSGTVEVDAISLSTLSSSARSQFRLEKIGFVFQAYNLIPVFTALENVEFTMQLLGVAAHDRQQRAREALAQVGLSGLEGRFPGELSGGQQQRVAVARAIVTQPKLVLADEPTANLDSKTSEALIELMRHMNTEHGVTFLFSTHDPLVMKSARRVIELQDGELRTDEVQTYQNAKA